MKELKKRRLKLTSLVGLLIFLIVFAATGCSGTKAPQETKVSYVEVKDAVGRTVKIQESVKKIVSIYGMIPQFVYLLGEGDKFYAGGFWGTDFYKLVDPDVMTKASRGKTANVEEIAKEKPNVVLCSYWQANNKDVKQLESLNIPVICTKVESIEDINNTVSMLGKVFQKEKQAQNIVDYYKKAEQNVKDKIQRTTKPKVLIMYYSGKDHSYMTMGGDMFQSRLVEIAGGTSVSQNLSGKKSIDVEQSVKWNPDMIMIIQYDKSAAQTKDEILKDPAWGKINAVKDGKVFLVPNDGDNWIDPCPKWPLGLYWAAKVLHPNEFKDINIKDKAKDFYKTFFGLNIDKVQINGNLITNE
ncbi:MAG: ABC transporter substrate-binding protein [Thermoanaerobacteraceae bacterium]|nr:ABC transporter substrate-binding protein [Thermoanaerobacteraceae bacterium]